LYVLRSNEMNKKQEGTEEPIQETKKRFLEAEESYQRMKKVISPYVEHKKYKEQSTEGEWQQTSSLYS
jgi:hypothetical protein